MSERKCTIENCERSHYAKDLCKFHYYRLRNFGDVHINKINNDIIILDDYAEMLIKDRNKVTICKVLIDILDVELIQKYKWCLNNKNKDGYVITNIRQDDKFKKLLLHRYLMEEELRDDLVVDHINRNKLDNRRINLRVCSKSVNCMNIDVRKDNTSGVTGVHFCKRSKKWIVQSNVNNKRAKLGQFDNKEDAIKLRADYEKEFYEKNLNQTQIHSKEEES